MDQDISSYYDPAYEAGWPKGEAAETDIISILFGLSMLVKCENAVSEQTRNIWSTKKPKILGFREGAQHSVSLVFFVPSADLGNAIALGAFRYGR